MKAGIVSLYGYFNYGNRLQSYAAQQVLRGLGFDTEVIYIQPYKKRIRELLIDLYFSKYAQLILQSSVELKNKYKRQKNFELFNNQFIHTKGYASIKAISDADYFVLGSDQVWNPKRYDNIKKELFLLTFTEDRKKVCFSPSFGVSKLPDEWKTYFKKHLETIPMLSVRETAGRDIIKELTGREAEVLIDPTLMIDADEWSKVIKKPSEVDVKNEYVLNYFIGGEPQKAKCKNEYLSREYRLEVYNMFDTQATGLFTSGPSEFLYLIKNAKIIQTDSFHACIFAFLFGRPFLLYAREGVDTDMLSRLETLFSMFDLERKFVDKEMPNDDFECNYENGYKRLEEERKKVYAFLRSSMGI
ncbi:polysaccharide pyruvyl transferase family protein [Oribacterium sp. WCC10]|uniref:polysaccharide pyruvyl transferase family protein n=1 Tax=Oribacterium sp. WCC10 TaxID=1855343 RepID=UPI0008F1ABE7|nr:polysaccharide pyruvyl transferase family protein [Oribacterium sp. WCC10]SFG65008.1 Polysaccharide pyruvyl transferase [Oribacterium sp. WCC10]